jgi:chaperonin GroES
MNTTGLTPIEYNIIVRPDPVEARTKGGVYIPDAVKEREEFATIKGTVIAVSSLAYSRTAQGDDWLGRKPEAGDRVLIAQYAGKNVTGSDGEKYRIMKDEDVMAVIDHE